MRRSLVISSIALVLASCGDQSGGEPVMRTEIGSGVAEETASPTSEAEGAPEAQANSPCRRTTEMGVIYTHCIADPGRHRVTMSLGPKGSYYRTFARLAGARSSTASPVVFAVNGGMYDEAGAPIGYYVEDGERRRELNRADGPGNFHMQPNGVFYGTDTSWRIRTTDDFYASVSDRPRFGTQSGPMLLIDGKLHPDFQEDGPSKMIRNGVGVDAQGRAHFVKSEGGVSFGRFAAYFRDVAKTPDALYLDGNVSALWSPGDDRMDTTVPLGPLIVVEERE
ncbi:phosphodiester glycosidase family protein [Altererythrobacter sp. MTPC7]|uniref:phosphodiester glycosidase family protein n=1 Tax=Altererythrobacter sp. MTPC7 TaxID=3056567 RepID=UPI0036F21E06